MSFPRGFGALHQSCFRSFTRRTLCFCSVRREHFREIQERLELARKRRLDQAPPEAASNESGEEKGATVLEIAGLEPEIEVAKVTLPPPKRRRIELGGAHSEEEESEEEIDHEAEDGGFLNWRSKRLPTT